MGIFNGLCARTEICWINGIPNDILSVILGFVGMTDQNVRCVCRRFRDCKMCVPCVEMLKCIRDRDIGNLCLLGVREFRMCKRNVTIWGMEQIGKMMCLRVLDLTYCFDVCDEMMSTIGNLVGLERLCLRGCDVSDAGIRYLVGIVGLWDLDLSFCDLVTGLHLDGFVELRKLSMRGCKDVNSSRVGKVKWLKELDFGDCVWGKELEELVNLQRLNLSSDCGMGIAHVPRILGLRSLNLRNTCEVEGLEVLKELIELEELKMSYWWMTGTIFEKYVVGLKRLRKLSIVGASTKLRDIGRLIRLESLRLCWTKGQSVRDLINLKELDVSYSCFDDDALRDLIGGPKLRILNVSGCRGVRDVECLERLKQEGVEILGV